MEKFIGFPLKDTGPEDSIRDKIQNRLGTLFGWYIGSGKIDLSKESVEQWLRLNVSVD